MKLRYFIRKCNYIFLIVAFLLIIGFVIHSSVNSSTFSLTGEVNSAVKENPLEEIDVQNDSYIPETIGITPEKSGFKLTILDVGQGSCALIESNGEYMIYDGGDAQTSSFVVAYLKAHNITHIKYLVASHYHADHINGLIGVLETIDVDSIICPDYVTDTECYKKFLMRVPEEKKIIPYVGQVFYIGDISAQVICPGTDEYSDDNGYSIGMLFQYETFRFLIDGDATAESESDMLEQEVELRADLLVVPHHGSTYSSSKEWLAKVAPTVAIISCGKDNSYYHPHESTLSRLQKAGVEALYRTDLQGTIVVTSDGNSYSITPEKTADVWLVWKPGTGGEKDAANTLWQTTEDMNLEDYYIGNIISGKFHRPSCSQLPKSENQELFQTRDMALLQGYIPCGSCNP